MNWAEVWTLLKDRFFHAIRLAITIGFDAGLFVGWLALDHWAAHLAESLQEP